MTSVQRTTSSTSNPVIPSDRVLKQGSTGTDVAELQRLLAKAGFSAGSADGDFGAKTRAAVVAFQRANGLGADGVVGPKSWQALRSQPSQAPQSSEPATGGSTALLKQGSHGASVVELQGLLEKAGHDVTADGDFGARTRAAVVAFQRANGLSADGVVGGRTWAALRGAAPQSPTSDDFDSGAASVSLAPRSASESEKYAHYARLVRESGGQVCANGQATVLGIRGMTLDGTRHASTSARKYDDVFVVLTPGGRCYEYRGATHPGQNSSTAAPDVTRDGQGDVGTIRPGSYSVKPNGLYHGNTSYRVQTQGGSGALAGWRDTNHDGTFSSAERTASEKRGDTLTGVLFHPGNADRPSSIGCQTLSPTDYKRFISAVGGSSAGFSYTLVQA